MIGQVRACGVWVGLADNRQLTLPAPEIVATIFDG
jgi:hypothetical protein